MALTQEQWYKKLRSWVPAWVFQKEGRNVAVFQAMAKVLAQYQEDAEAHYEQTFIDQAEGEILDLHGSERSLERFPGENDSAFRPRIKIIKNSSNCPTLKELIDAQLINPEAEIVEALEINNFLDREAFLNRGVLDTVYKYNTFFVFVPNQLKAAETFANRENFLDRESFTGQLESPISLFERLVDIVNKNKAFGTFYSLSERV